MLSYLQTNSGLIAYRLERSARKHILIRIEDNGDVRVCIPLYFPSASVDKFLQKKTAWIFRKSSEQRDRFARFANKKFVSGQEFFFLGKKYPLNIIYGTKNVQVGFDGLAWQINVSQQDSEVLRQKMVAWYRRQAQEMLMPRVFHYSQILGLIPEIVKIRSQKRLWGSCDQGKKMIHLNWQIIMSPLSVIDYVIVHELCHLKIANHSKRFWREVAKIIPDYQIKHQWLKQNAWEMRLPEAGL